MSTGVDNLQNYTCSFKLSFCCTRKKKVVDGCARGKLFHSIDWQSEDADIIDNGSRHYYNV